MPRSAHAHHRQSVAAYIRVSTDHQSKGEASQEHVIQQYLDNHGLDAKFYRDRLSGGTINRPEFKKLQKAIFNGQVKTVIVWKLERIARSQREGINLLHDWLSKDVRVVSVAQQIDFSGTIGQMIAGLLFALGQLDLETIRENTKRGLAAARARGVQLGRRPSISVEQVQVELAKGVSVAEAAKNLSCSRQSVYRLIRQQNS